MRKNVTRNPVNQRNVNPNTSFLLPSGKKHSGKTYESYYAELEVTPPEPGPPREVKIRIPKIRKPRKKRQSGIDPYYKTHEWRILRFDTLQRDKYICRYCGEKALQADHVIPRLKGGPNHLDNLVACCSSCNRIAGGKAFQSVESKKSWILSKRKNT